MEASSASWMVQHDGFDPVPLEVSALEPPMSFVEKRVKDTEQKASPFIVLTIT